MAKLALPAKSIVALTIMFSVGFAAPNALAEKSDKTDEASATQLFDQGWSAYRGQKYDDAMLLFRRAAAMGSLQAEYQIGEMYSTALGVPEDMAQARVWYSKAAEKGMPEAQVAVGQLYSNGWGVEQDERKALDWYRKAANQGYAPAEAFVGIAYLNGLGVSEDFTQARTWLDKAIDAGDAEAEVYLCGPYRSAWIEAVSSKDAARMDHVIANIDTRCTDLLRQAKETRGQAGR
jgi:TPR repeat protein